WQYQATWSFLATDRPYLDLTYVAEQQFVKPIREGAFGIQEKAQRVELELRKLRSAQALEFNPNRSGGAIWWIQPIVRINASSSHRQGPQGNRIAGAEAAWSASDSVRTKHLALRDLVATGELSLVRVDHKLNN